MLYDYDDPKSVLEFINYRISNISSCVNPILLILYGPSGTGKSTILPYVTKKMNINDNYLFLSTDDLIMNTVQYNELRKTDISNKTFLEESYHKIRERVKHIRYMLMGLSIMFKYNVVMEFTGTGFKWYIENMVTNYKYSGYRVELCYPLITNIQELIDRINKRGQYEFRFVPDKLVEKSYKMSIINFIDMMKGKYDNIINRIVVYDDKNNIIYSKEKGKIFNEANIRNIIRINSKY
jgi:predicted ABC-type ATPase